MRPCVPALLVLVLAAPVASASLCSPAGQPGAGMGLLDRLPVRHEAMCAGPPLPPAPEPGEDPVHYAARLEGWGRQVRAWVCADLSEPTRPAVQVAEHCGDGTGSQLLLP